MGRPNETTRRDLLRRGSAGALALGLSGPAALAQTAEPGGRRASKKIRYAHSAPTSHGWHLWGEQFKQSIETKSGSKIQVSLFPNAQMGPERDIAQAVRLGSLEMGSVGVALMNWVPELSVTDAPYLFETRSQAYNALDGALGSELKKRAQTQAFRIVSWNDLGFRAMTNNKHPITEVADMRDLKMRVPDSKSYFAMMLATGASVATVDLSELYLALAQGVADGQETPVTVVKSNKYYDVQKYISKTDHILTNAYTIINPAFFDALSKGEQEMVLAASDEATRWLRNFTQKDELSAYDFLKEKGMEVNLKPDLESFRQACSGVIAKLPELFRPDLVQLARSAKA
jgi:tripartite ATP-independent transporter DctP family solute receptor